MGEAIGGRGDGVEIKKGEVVVLKITLKPDGQLDVSGPIQHKILALGMLALATECVMSYKPNPDTSNILVASQLPKVPC